MEKMKMLVPFRPGNRERDENFILFKEYYSRILPDWQILTFDSGHEPFSRSASRNLAVNTLSDDEIAVLVDGDTLGTKKCLESATSGGLMDRLVVPYTHFRGLSKGGRVEMMAGRQLKRCKTVLETYNSVGGIWVIRAGLYRALGGMDERFTGWGFEDNAFYNLAEEKLGPVIRFSGPLYHIYHKNDFTINNAQYVANKLYFEENYVF